MSLKNNIDMVKEELNSEEKFFEKAVVTEKFIKKYKKPLIGSVIAVVLLVAADITYSINKQNTIDAANATLQELQKNASNPATLARLKSLSPELHDVWLYSQAITTQNVQDLETLKGSKALLIGDMAKYEAAELKNDPKLLEKYAKQQDAIYKDLALVELAIIAMNDGKIDEAHGNLSMISSQSPLAVVAQSLMHYGVK
ncbi:tetratricopeptide repeat protein [Sulfurimonas sp. C5]|uniref:tetratricopeptide repeat protein n=1 Tax=Sulfurimonas sp. C5 TaxID=3036947 RepID=UPI002456DAF6|nr:tetratricopeptide repeat protein [Sulfurimonas sp. C5]MDH4944158.1 tetratricopeptide repeat protein [Sulfurimonas sp. C5]